MAPMNNVMKVDSLSTSQSQPLLRLVVSRPRFGYHVVLARFVCHFCTPSSPFFIWNKAFHHSSFPTIYSLPPHLRVLVVILSTWLAVCAFSFNSLYLPSPLLRLLPMPTRARFCSPSLSFLLARLSPLQEYRATMPVPKKVRIQRVSTAPWP
jgi:hypothetical protein